MPLIKECSKALTQKKRFGIMTYDLSAWKEMLSNPRFLNCLRKMGQYSKNILLVFRLQKEDMISVIEEDLNDIMKEKNKKKIGFRVNV